MRGLMLILIFYLASVAPAEVTTFTLPISPPNVSSDGKVSPDHNCISAKAGEPAIPYECYRIAIPFGKRVAKSEVKLSEFVELTGKYRIPCAQHPIALCVRQVLPL